MKPSWKWIPPPTSTVPAASTLGKAGSSARAMAALLADAGERARKTSDRPTHPTILRNLPNPSMRVAELREMCRAEGVPVSGTKSALIERLTAHVEKRQNEGLSLEECVATIERNGGEELKIHRENTGPLLVEAVVFVTAKSELHLRKLVGSTLEHIRKRNLHHIIPAKSAEVGNNEWVLLDLRRFVVNFFANKEKRKTVEELFA